ncbi:MAG: cation transporter [Saprospiraceae bacterium]|nr:cation transporter [Saprospiraceae bacterium]
MESTLQNLRIQRWVLIVGLILFVVKVAAWYMTNSVAILTDALESTVNVFSAALGLYSLWLASKPRDANHPYGHGKVEFLSAAVEGTLIGVAGGMIIWEAVHRLLVHEPVSHLDLGLLLVGIAGGFNFLVGMIAKRAGQRNHSIALASSGRHLLSDAYSTGGLIIGLALMLVTGYSWIDATVAIVFGVIILVTGYRILRKSIAGIMDEADEALFSQIDRPSESSQTGCVVDIHNLRIIKYGSILHIDCHLTVPWYFHVQQAHEEVDALEKTVQVEFENRVELFVHTDSCRPSACQLCHLPDCPERQFAFARRVDWTLQNVLSDQRHSLESKKKKGT